MAEKGTCVHSFGGSLLSDGKWKRGMQNNDMLAIDDDLVSYLSGDTFYDSDFASPVTNSHLDMNGEACSDENLEVVDDPCKTPNRQDGVIVHMTTGNRRGDSHSRSAINARENRKKKKKYMTGLEETVQQLARENDALKRSDKRQKKSIKKLQMENAYLKSVLANQSTLSAILKSVKKTPGVKFLGNMPLTSGEIGEAPAFTLPSHESKQLQITDSDTAVTEESHAETQQLSSGKFVQTTLHVKQDMHYIQADSSHIQESEGSGLVNGIFSSLSSSLVTGEEVIQIDDETDGDTDSAEEEVDVEENGSTAAGAGVCLHVSGQRVSLEFCASCNNNAEKSCTADHAYVKLRD